MGGAGAGLRGAQPAVIVGAGKRCPVTEPKRDDETQTLTDWLGFTDAPRWWVARPLGAVVGVVLALFVLVALPFAMIATWAVMYGTVRDVLENEAAGPNLGAGALIAAILGAPFLIWSTVLKHQTLRYQKEGHITDRINKAVEQLGAEKTLKLAGVEETKPNIEVRIGAILSLERIAQDSTKHDKGRDHVRVMEILCAYIRENAPASGANALPFPRGNKDDEDELLSKRGQHSAIWILLNDTPPPRIDIQMAIKVIGLRSPAQRAVEANSKVYGPQGFVLDLSNCNFQRAELGSGPVNPLAVTLAA